MSILKYPRTQHIEGSRLQPGDEDLSSVPASALSGKHVIVEEKVDGANCGISFTADGEIRLQSRGHFLVGGYREKHWDLFKQWAHIHRDALWERLGDRFVVYGEWLYAKHTVFYDRLPHFLLEFDVFDRHADRFLSTPRRRDLLGETDVCQVPVLHEGRVDSRDQLQGLLGESAFKSESWQEALLTAAARVGIPKDQVLRETDPSDEMEGLYIKVESEDRVEERYKFVRATFLTSVCDSGSHWLNRRILPNELIANANLIDGRLG